MSLQLAYSVSTSPGAVVGHVYDRAEPARRFVVELWADGTPVAAVRANLLNPALDEAEGFDRCCGFYIPLPKRLTSAHAELRLANLDIGLGGLFALESEGENEYDKRGRPAGAVRWYGGVRLKGWARARPSGEAPVVSAFIGDFEVARVEATAVTNVEDAGETIAAPDFDLHLPLAFADGDVHVVEVKDADGATLDGSPLAFLAFADGLRAQIVDRPPLQLEALRGEMFDRLVPQSVPFAYFDAWLQRFPNRPSKPSGLVVTALIGPGDAEASVASLAERAGCNWIAAALPEAGGQTAFEPSDLIDLLEREAAGADIVAFVLAGSDILPQGLALLADTLERDPTAILVYADIVALADEGERIPVAMPEYSYERLIEQGYPAFLFAMRRGAALKAARDGAGDLFALLFAAVGSAGPAARVRRAPGFAARLPAIDRLDANTRLARAVGAHLEARGIAAALEPLAAAALFPAIRVRRRGSRPTLSAIIPTRDRVDLLRRCVDSIGGALAGLETELIIVDNGSSNPETLRYLDEVGEARATVLRDHGPFNFSRLNNYAATIAVGETLAFINNDIEALDDGWLDEMLSRLAEPDVGAVGAKLIWPSGVVQHGGVTLGLFYGAGHAFTEAFDGAPGYADLLAVARETSAVTAACLVTRKRHFEAVGGFDEWRYPVNFNDVDYCLKLGEHGLRVVFTPHARLRHHESASRGDERRADLAARAAGELRALRDRWAAKLAFDPCYSPMLSLDGRPYTALAWPPRRG